MFESITLLLRAHLKKTVDSIHDRDQNTSRQQQQQQQATPWVIHNHMAENMSKSQVRRT